MNMQKRWGVAVLLVVVIVVSMQAVNMRPSVVRGQAGGEDSDAPYIYYFSSDLNAWVIERADGSDRRLLGQGLMTAAGTTAVSAGEWSPSGKWFTWSSFVRTQDGPWGGYEYDNTHYWLVDTGGDSVPIDRTGVWSSTQDQMLIQDEYQYFRPPFWSGERPIHHVRYSLFDANRKRVVWAYERQFQTLVYGFDIEWMSDGQSILLNYKQKMEGSWRHTFILRKPNGSLHRVEFVADTYFLSPNGTLIYQWGDALHILNLYSRQNQQISLTDYLSRTFYINWNIEGSGALIRFRESNEWNAKVLAWVWLNIPNISLKLISNELDYLPCCANWDMFPSRNYPNRVGRYIYFRESDSALRYFDTVTETVTSLPFAVKGNFESDWVGDDLLYIFLYDEPDNSETAWLVDFSNGTIMESPVIAYNHPMRRSTDKRYLAWMSDGPMVYEVATGQKKALPPDDRAYMGSIGDNVEWHPIENWFFVYERGFEADGGGNARLYPGVASADGSVRREIYGVEMRWLPPQVNPDHLPPPELPKPKPIAILHGTDWSEFILWSPDGRFLMANNANDWGTHNPPNMNVWDVWGETLIGQLRTADANRRNYLATQLYWEQVPSGVYVPRNNPKLPPLDPESPQATSIAYNPTRQLVLQTDVYPAHVYTWSSHELVFEFPIEGIFIKTAEFSPDGSLLVLSGWDEGTEIWSTETWQPIYKLDATSTEIAFSPDGDYLAVGVSWDVEIWRVSDLIGAGVGEN